MTLEEQRLRTLNRQYENLRRLAICTDKGPRPDAPVRLKEDHTNLKPPSSGTTLQLAAVATWQVTLHWGNEGHSIFNRLRPAATNKMAVEVIQFQANY